MGEGAWAGGEVEPPALPTVDDMDGRAGDGNCEEYASQDVRRPWAEET